MCEKTQVGRIKQHIELQYHALTRLEGMFVKPQSVWVTKERIKYF